MMMCFAVEGLSDDTCSVFVWPRNQLYLRLQHPYHELSVICWQPGESQAK